MASLFTAIRYHDKVMGRKPSKPAPSVGQLELAKLFGVSQKTVSLALHNKPGVSEELRRKIQAAARERGYRFNTAARAMLRGRHNMLSLVASVHQYRSILDQQLLTGMDNACRECGQQLVLNRFSDDRLTDPAYVPRILREWHSDGLLFLYNADMPARMVELVERFNMPAIWVNSRHPRDAIRPDDHGAAVEATGQLLERGHRRIAYVDFTNPVTIEPSHYSSNARQQAYEQTMREAGCSPQRIGSKENRNDTLEVLQTALAGNDRPSGLLCYSTFEARIAYAAALLCSLRVPEDLSLVCFAGSGPREGMGKPITAMLLPLERIGYEAVQMLMDKIANRDLTEPERLVPFRFVEGGTLAPAR